MGVREMDRFLERCQMDARYLRRRMILSPTPRDRERWYALLLLAQGWTASSAADVSNAAIYRPVKRRIAEDGFRQDSAGPRP